MSIRLTLITAICIAVTSISNAQTREVQGTQIELETSTESNTLTPEKSDAQITKELYQELEGTFLVIYSDPEYNILYTRNLLETIRGSRLLDAVAYLTWDQFTTIKIFPSSTLNNAEAE